MDLQLTDKVALVTAASQGLGLATAMALASEGANVIISSRSSIKLDEAVEKIKLTTGNQAAASILLARLYSSMVGCQTV
jgi:3-oxoacyl-[acyl-carrier protein] reductase